MQTRHEIARPEGLPIIDKHMNAMDFVLERAVSAQNGIWSAVDCMIVEPGAIGGPHIERSAA